MNKEKKLAVLFPQVGNPPDVIELVELDLDHCKDDEVIIDVEYATINPAHLLVLSGKYGKQPNLPSVPGGEGVGLISEVGKDVQNYRVGERVMIPQTGTWRQQVKVKAKNLLMKFPEHGDPVQLSMLMANPPTAWLLLKTLVELKKGDWLIQNAANSAVGQYVMQLSSLYGYKTINIVRSQEQEKIIKQSGGDICLIGDQNLVSSVAEITKKSRVLLALDAIAGDSTQTLADCLSDNGVIGNYGLLSGKHCQLSSQNIIFRNISLRGVWLSRWLSKTNTPQEIKKNVYQELTDYILNGKLKAEVEAIYELEDVEEAVKHAMRAGRSGKILLKPNGF